MRRITTILLTLTLLAALQLGPGSPPARAHGSDAMANDHSENPGMSGDGRFVAFITAADNLVTGDTNGNWDVFVRDRQTLSTERISVSDDGTQSGASSRPPVLSRDGRYIAFSSSAPLVSDDTNNRPDVYVHDRWHHRTRRVSVGSQGQQGFGWTDYPAISGDGNYVAFASQSENLVANDTNGTAYDIFLHDLRNGETTLVSRNSHGVHGNSSSFGPWLSFDARYVSFQSVATNLVPNDTNGEQDVFVRDRETNTTTRVSVSSSGIQANAHSGDAIMSNDGRYVAFQSSGNNLTASDTNGTNDVFVHDRLGARTARASVSSSSIEANGDSSDPYISGNGRFVTFHSAGSNLVSNDTNGTYDIFVRDLATASTHLVSRGSTGGGNLSSYQPVTDDGTVAAFESDSTNLVNEPLNGYRHVFVASITGGSVEVVSRSGNVAPFTRLSVSPDAGDGSTTFTADTAGTLDQNGDAMTHRIDWGDGSTTTAATGTHSYAPGTYTITATATDSHGASSSTSRKVSVTNDTPSANLIVTPLSGQKTATLFTTSITASDPNSDPLTYLVDWGDGTITESTGAEDTHRYSTLGTKSITGWVVDRWGAASPRSTVEVIVGNTAPEASLQVSPPSGFRGTSFTAEASATDINEDSVSYSVEWGDGATTQGPSSSHEYGGAPGTRTIELTATDQWGATDSVMTQVELVNRAPDVGLTITPGTGDVTTTFEADLGATSDLDGDAFTYTIDWGDPLFAADPQSSSHRYALPGTYVITAQVTDAYGATASESYTLEVCAVGSAGCEAAEPEPFCEVESDAMYACEERDFAWQSLNAPIALRLAEDGTSAPIALPFAFTWYGQAKTHVSVSSNGPVCFADSPSCGSFQAQQLPKTSSPNDLAACFWEDLSPADGGTVRYAVHGSMPNRTLVVEFEAVPHYYSTRTNSFQTHIHENGSVSCMLKNVSNDEDGASSVRGTEDSRGELGSRYRFGEFGAQNVGVRFKPTAAVE